MKLNAAIGALGVTAGIAIDEPASREAILMCQNAPITRPQKPRSSAPT
jgi:hypothetical protein